MNELTQRGIEALRSGDRSAARMLLGAALKQDPNDATAWLWLTGALESETERIQCLRQVLRIDPQNAAAARGLELLLGQRANEPPAAAPTEPAPEDAAPLADAAPAPIETAAPSGVEVFSEAVAPEQPEEPALPAAPVETAAAGAERQPDTDTPEVASQELLAEAAPAEAAPQRRRVRAAAGSGQVIFRTRPSIVPAMLGFWIFLLGAVGIGVLLRESPVLSMTLAIGLVIFLELIFIYTLFRNMAIRYELTDQTLLLRFRGKRVQLPHADIYSAECRQSFFQRVLGTGDIHLRAAVKGELAELRLRNIPECDKRRKQIIQYIQPAD